MSQEDSDLEDLNIRTARKSAHERLHPPWEGVFRLSAFVHNRALRRSLPVGHVLADGHWTAIARNTESDDVLYANGDGRIAKVHLTYRMETDPDFPATTFFSSLDEFLDWLQQEYAFLQRLIAQDDADQICTQCGANWSAGQHGHDCRTCGGFALQRPCPICGGACDAQWNRAVLDSNDQREAHWIGACRGKTRESPVKF